MHRTAFISSSDCGRHDTGWGHPEHVGRLVAIMRAVRNDYEMFPLLDHVQGRSATVDELALVHDRQYVESIRRICAAGGGRLDVDTVASEGSWDAATAAAGCVLDALDMAFDGRAKRSLCAVRPPGHHALCDRSMGFCIFGSVAVGAFYALEKLGASRVLIADWDVHHGNGTQALVQSDSRIRFLSMHQWPFYPGTGAANDRGPFGTVTNVPLRAGLAPTDYVDAFERAFDSVLSDFRPDVILLSAGFDCLAGDAIGGFTLEMEHVDRLTRFVVQRAEEQCEGRLVSALEGGYTPARLAEAVVVHLRGLAGLPAAR
ncbi:MAG: histone deacetylase [Gemmatimonadota bacterium]|nr:histone deacetylase [Gemmatimonadota bacterium]